MKYLSEEKKQKITVNLWFLTIPMADFRRVESVHTRPMEMIFCSKFFSGIHLVIPFSPK